MKSQSTYVAAFARVLRRKRSEQALTQSVLSEMAGIDRTYVSMLERGVKSPTLDVMVSIAEALHISFVELTIAVQAEVLAEQSGS